MKKFTNYLNIYKPPKKDAEFEKKSEKKIVSRLAEGNVSLQCGNYLTKEDIDKKRKKYL